MILCIDCNKVELVGQAKLCPYCRKLRKNDVARKKASQDKRDKTRVDNTLDTVDPKWLRRYNG